MGRGNGWRDAGDRRPHARAARRAARRARPSSRSCPRPRARCGPPSPTTTSRSNLLRPSVSGDPRIGGTLTCDHGHVGRRRRRALRVRRYFWTRRGVRRADRGRHGATYVVTAADAGQPLYCDVVAVNGRAGAAQPAAPACRRAAPREPQRAGAQRRPADRRRAALHARRLGRPRPDAVSPRRSIGRATARRSKGRRRTRTTAARSSSSCASRSWNVSGAFWRIGSTTISVARKTVRT